MSATTLDPQTRVWTAEELRWLPAVERDAILAAAAERAVGDYEAELQIVHSDPETLGGAPVFVGTRVPFRALIDYLCGDQPLSEFLEDFPSVSREQAIASLRMATQLAVTHACAAR